MLPGKKYHAEDLLHVGWRFKWIIAAAFVVVSAGTAAYTSLLPDRYRADEVIEVVPQRVSQAYVRSTVAIRLEDRLGAISQRIQSRTSLERIIRDFNLYERERQRMVMEDVVEQMRRDIETVAVRADAFRLCTSRPIRGRRRTSPSAWPRSSSTRASRIDRATRIRPPNSCPRSSRTRGAH